MNRLNGRLLLTALVAAMTLWGCGDDSRPLPTDSGMADGGGDADTDGGTDGGDVCEGLTLCDPAGTSCNGDTLVVCAADADGCLVETSTDCTTSGGSCDDSGAAAVCTADPCAGVDPSTVCTTDGERLCAADTLRVCGDNGTGCLVYEDTDCASSPGGVCDESGADPVCALPADPCAGIADACAAEGTTCNTDELVTCAPNAFGCLVETTTDCTSRAGGTCDDTGAVAACTFTSDPCDSVTECATVGTACSGPELVTCAVDAFGCQVETRDDCTAATFGFCDTATDPNMCSTAAVDPCMGMTVCTPAGVTCVGDTLTTCALNAFGCLAESAVDCTATAEVCDDTGATPMCIDLCAGVDCSGESTTCRAAACNPASGLCDVFTDATDGIACSSTTCATDEVCTTGVCGGGTVICDYEYSEDFEAGDGGWVTGGTTSWEYGAPAGGLPDPGTGNLWATNLSGNYGNGEDGYIESPVLDLSGASADPILSFDLYYETESCCDEGFVDISIDGGTTYTRLGAAGDGYGWYNDAGNDWWDGTNGGWSRAGIPLTGTAGLSDVRLRVYFDSDSSVSRDGFGIDNVLVRTNLPDLAATELTLVGDCPSATSSLQFTVQNLGLPVSTFDVAVSVDGAAATTETITPATPLAWGEVYVVDLTTTVDVSGPAHTVVATLSYVGDADPTNDSASLDTQVVVLTAAAGYSQDFEAGPAGWTAGGGNSTWAHGAPTGTDISGAGSGTSAWVTNLTGNYNSNEESAVTSLCFDMSALTADPTLAFLHNFETESCCDEGYIEVWTATTGTWTVLGDEGTGVNWYNDGTEWNGSTAGAWRTASHVLTGASGESQVRIRHVLSTDGSITREGFGLDLVTITP